MAVNILTTDDLQKFKDEFFAEFKLMINRQTKSDSPNKREWLRTKEVCKMLGISLSKLQYMRDNGEIKFTRIGGTIFYSLEEINKLLSSNSNQLKAF